LIWPKVHSLHWEISSRELTELQLLESVGEPLQSGDLGVRLIDQLVNLLQVLLLELPLVLDRVGGEAENRAQQQNSSTEVDDALRLGDQAGPALKVEYDDLICSRIDSP